MLRIVLIAFLVSQDAQTGGVGVRPAAAPDDERSRPGFAEKIGRLMNELRRRPWEEQYAYMIDSMERVYARNDWTSEQDLFSLEMVREVGSVPPWQLQERFDRTVGMFSDRYFLDPAQEQVLRRLMIRDTTRLFLRNSGRIMQYATEIIQTRMADEAFTPEQVARWTELATPVFDDARRTMERSSKEFMAKLDPEQRTMVQRDLEAARGRLGRVIEMAESWKRGEWDPADWGMEEDAIQLAGMRKLERREVKPAGDATERPSEPESVRRQTDADALVERVRERPPPRATQTRSETTFERTWRPAKAAKGPKVDDEWSRYVREFVARYRLNPEQDQRAWLIHKDATTRRDHVRKRHAAQLEARYGKSGAKDDSQVRESMRGHAKKQNATLERLFEQMKRRLERLPTRKQRQNAAPEKSALTDKQGPQSAKPRPDQRGKTP